MVVSSNLKENGIPEISVDTFFDFRSYSKLCYVLYFAKFLRVCFGNCRMGKFDFSLSLYVAENVSLESNISKQQIISALVTWSSTDKTTSMFHVDCVKNYHIKI